MRPHAASFVSRPRRPLTFLAAAAITLALAGGCADVIGLPDDTLCGPSGAGGCGGGAPGVAAPSDGGTDATDATH